MSDIMLNNWRSFWENVRAKNDPDIVYNDKLDRGYSEPNRGYHNWNHIDDFRRKLHEPEVYCHLNRPLVAEGTMWFHDVVYRSSDPFNEIKSSMVAAESFRNAGLPDDFIYPVVEQILITRHSYKRDNIDLDTQIVLDIDLSILGEEPHIFDEYEKGVMKEYVEHGSITLDEFRAGRAHFLENMLGRDRIFRTPLFRRKYEEHARKNIRRSIDSLRD